MKSRIASIDIFRALTMFLMIFVNDLWTLHDIPSWLEHAEAHEDGMGLADLVFPAFLFIVGLSVPFAIKARLNKGDSRMRILIHIFTRSAALIVMGFFMVNQDSLTAGWSMGLRNLWQIYLYGNEGFIYSANRVAENEDDSLLEGLVIYKNHVPAYTLPLYYVTLKNQIMESEAYDSLLWDTDTIIDDMDFKKMVSEERLRYVSFDLTDTTYVGAITTRFFFYKNDYGYNMTFISVDTAYSLNRVVFDNIMSTFHYIE